MRSRRRASLAAPLLAAALAGSVPLAAEMGSVEGTATLAWGDPQRGPSGGPLRLTVLDDAGRLHVFTLPYGSAAARFDPGAAQGRRVRVVADTAAPEGAEPLAVVFLGAAAPDAAQVAGSQPWVSLLCKFSNLATEPRTASFFSQMYGNSPGQLDHYWREVSYDQIDVVGSTASSWLVLPRAQTAYVPTPAPAASTAAPPTTPTSGSCSPTAPPPPTPSSTSRSAAPAASSAST